MPRILIAEDEGFFSANLAALLLSDGHNVEHVSNGQEAREMLERQDFDCVIGDAKMPVMNGIDLALWILANKPTPFIIVAAFADQADPAKPFGLAGVTLLVKPFKPDEVRRAVKSAVPSFAGERDSYEALTELPKGALREGTTSEFDLFQYLNGRPRELLKKGQTFFRKSLGLEPHTKIYTDRPSLKAALAGALSLNPGETAIRPVDPARRAVILQNALQILHEHVRSFGFDPTVAGDSIDMVNTYLRSIDETAFWDLMAGLDAYSRPIYAQTLAVTMVCTLIAQEQRFTTHDIFKLMSAAIFHDIGQMALDPVLVKTPRVLLSMKDRAQLEKHVELGVTMLQRSGTIPTEICAIVWQHHESEIGNGYPRGLIHHQIHPMARLLRVADDFCVSVMKVAGSPGMPSARAIESLKNKPELDPKFVIALHRVLNLSRSKQQA
jgi:response regulator RpfG family c-di-GMP phosphodiesterase